MTKSDDLEAVRLLVETLSPFETKDRERIIRWAWEKLGMASGPATAPAIADASRAAVPATEAPTSPVTGRTPDIKTFVESKKPKSDMQFATVVAYYYRFEAGQSQRRETITSELLQEAARLCARPRFKHPVMTLTNAKNQGYLDLPSRGEFAINTVGENLVAMTLPGGESASNGKRKKRKKSAPTRRVVRR